MRSIVNSLVFLLIYNGIVSGQTEHYRVEKAGFSSDIYDEYAPVIFREGIVFCSNRSNDLFLAHKNSRHKNLFNIYYIDLDADHRWKDATLMDPGLTTRLNDGPASFNARGNSMVYSRNLNTQIGIGNQVDPGNVLGLFLADYVGGEWTNIRPFPHNNARYSLTMPAMDSAGQMLIFTSDIRGGFGGSDLYLSRYVDGKWIVPENMGPGINSSANETYPFLSYSGILYFSSDRQGGFGKKDIYRSDYTEGGWSEVIHLESPINSEFDDFGLVCDDNFETGWFSSDRNTTDDIFLFETRFRPFYGCDSIKKNHYCFLFSESNYFENDSISVQYEWTFSDGAKLDGIEVEHCFPGPGKYSVKLKIIQTYAEEDYVTETSHEFELKDHEQAVISSADSCMVNDTIQFDGLGYNLPGFTADEYFWDFGDGTLEIGPEVSHVYRETGSFRVQLGLTGKDDMGNYQENCVFKVIRVDPDEGILP